MADRLVLDASVAAKWFLRDEPDVDLADLIQDAFLAGDVELHVPALFRYEIATLFAKACGTRDHATGEPRITLAGAREALDDLERMPLTMHETNATERHAALELAVRCSKRFRDMTYVWLAQHLDGKWCTADDRALRGGASEFPIDRVVLLSSLRDQGSHAEKS